jgi:hypothetical protein
LWRRDARGAGVLLQQRRVAPLPVAQTVAAPGTAPRRFVHDHAAAFAVRRQRCSASAAMRRRNRRTALRVQGQDPRLVGRREQLTYAGAA